MEEFTNRELKILMDGIKTQIENLEDKHDKGILALQQFLFGNGKAGFIEETNNCLGDLKSWKRGITMIITCLVIVVLPVGFIVIRELISKYI